MEDLAWAGPPSPPQRKVLADGVYEAIRARLMDLAIPPASKMNIEALARDLEVSPTPVREALARLEAEGLVTKRPLVGYSSAPLLDTQGLLELYDLRLLLEPAAARWATEIMSRDEVQAVIMAGHPISQAHSGDTFRDYRSFFEADGAFHRLIAEASRRHLLVDALNRLHAHVQLYRFYHSAGIADATDAEHHRITEAMLARDSAAAGEAMTAHLEASRARMVAAARVRSAS